MKRQARPQKPNRAETRPFYSEWDYMLLVATLCLVGVGLVMVFSSSSVLAEKRFGDPFHFLRPQLTFVLLGLAVMMIFKNIPYQFFCRTAYIWIFLCLIGLVAVIIPGIGFRAGGRIPLDSF